MTDTYNGIVGNVTPNLPAPVGISASSNTTPVVVTTSTPHLLTTGDVVKVNDHQTNTGINKTWAIHVVDSLNVILVGSTAGGAGGATGAVQSLNFGTIYNLPTDGQRRDALSVNQALEALGDRTSSLLANVARWKTLEIIDHQVDDDTTEGTDWSTLHTFSSSNTWERIATLYTFNTGILQLNDNLSFQFTGSAHVVNSGASVTNDAMLCLFVSEFVAGGSASGVSKVPGSGVALATPVTGGGYDISCGVSLYGRWDMSGNQNYAVYLYGYTRNGTPGNVTIEMLGDHQTRTVIRRPTDYTRLA
jgi:hypothetical protein